MLPASRSAARACSVNPGEAGRGASAKVEKGGADSVPPPQEDEGSSAQESADVEENGARASPLRVWSFALGSCQPLQLISMFVKPVRIRLPRGLSTAS